MNGLSRFEEILAKTACTADAALESLIPQAEGLESRVVEAMRYSALSGGKRLRPFLVLASADIFNVARSCSERVAAAVEMIHCYSLIHDDLPAMDDDDLRRGRPSCHKAFGEAVAILAGDGLLALAFEILATKITDSAVAAAAAAELARATGWAGMIGGQTTDILSEHEPPELSLVRRIHRYKTGRLFECAARLGAITAGADPDRTEAVATFGQQLGLAFQVADDLLDVTGREALIGKAVAKDAGAGKQTYPAVVGPEASREAAREALQRAVDGLERFGPAADDLRQLAQFVVERDK